MDEKGVTDHAEFARVTSAVGMINRQGKVRLNLKGFHPASGVKIFKTLISTKLECDTHLTPMKKPLLSAMEAAEGLLYKYVFGKYT